MKFAAVSAAYLARESGCMAGFCDRRYNKKKIICVYIITDREVFQDTQTCRHDKRMNVYSNPNAKLQIFKFSLVLQ